MIDFELIVPDGWVHIPTTPDTGRLRRRSIDELIRRHVPDSLPRDKAGPWRTMLRRELVEATDEASRHGARAVLLPLKEFNGFRLPGSMLVTVVEEGDDVEDPEKLLAGILSDAGEAGAYLEIGGCPAVRVARVVDSRAIGRRAPSWRVSYYVSHPDEPGVWGLLNFTVLTDGDVHAEPVWAVVLLFDSVVCTLRWENRVDVPAEDEAPAEPAGPSSADGPADEGMKNS